MDDGLKARDEELKVFEKSVNIQLNQLKNFFLRHLKDGKQTLLQQKS